jgi:hypothetical protein
LNLKQINLGRCLKYIFLFQNNVDVDCDRNPNEKAAASQPGKPKRELRFKRDMELIVDRRGVGVYY